MDHLNLRCLLKKNARHPTKMLPKYLRHLADVLTRLTRRKGNYQTDVIDPPSVGPYNPVGVTASGTSASIYG